MLRATKQEGASRGQYTPAPASLTQLRDALIGFPQHTDQERRAAYTEVVGRIHGGSPATKALKYWLRAAPLIVVPAYCRGFEGAPTTALLVGRPAGTYYVIGKPATLVLRLENQDLSVRVPQTIGGEGVAAFAADIWREQVGSDTKLRPYEAPTTVLDLEALTERVIHETLSRSGTDELTQLQTLRDDRQAWPQLRRAIDAIETFYAVRNDAVGPNVAAQVLELADHVPHRPTQEAIRRWYASERLNGDATDTGTAQTEADRQQRNVIASLRAENCLAALAVAANIAGQLSRAEDQAEALSILADDALLLLEPKRNAMRATLARVPQRYAAEHLAAIAALCTAHTPIDLAALPGDLAALERKLSMPPDRLRQAVKKCNSVTELVALFDAGKPWVAQLKTIAAQRPAVWLPECCDNSAAPFVLRSKARGTVVFSFAEDEVISIRISLGDGSCSVFQRKANRDATMLDVNRLLQEIWPTTDFSAAERHPPSLLSWEV